MNKEIETLLSLKRILAEMARGRGVSASLVGTYGQGSPGFTSVARLVLLGFPPESSMGQLLSSGGEESRMLAALIVRGAKGDTPVAGRKGEQISSSLEKWVRARESRRMEEKVMRFRGFVMTGVLGAVAAMVSSMGPLVSGLSFAGGPAPASPTLLKECAASMAALSSAMLGLYISGWRGIMNAALSLAVFALVSTSVAPLASVPLQGLGAIK